MIFREVRDKLAITQEEMAAYIGVKRSILSMHENGKRPLEWIEKAIKLNELLRKAGYSLEDLVVPSDSDNSIPTKEN